jgi:hypothetical protein
MSLVDKATRSRLRTAGEACPAWCALGHDLNGQPGIVLHESLPAVTEISRPREFEIPEWIDVRTTQYSPEEPGELPGPPVVELSCHQGGRYRVITLTPEEARYLAVSLYTAAAHADGDPRPRDLHATKAPDSNALGTHGGQS